MENVIKNYTVCFLFDETLEHVLLQTKGRTTYAGRLNGVGGKIESNETPREGALRKIEEETGLKWPRTFCWLGTLALPFNCENPDVPDEGLTDPACTLYYFAGTVLDRVKLNPPKDGEPVAWYDVDEILSRPVTDMDLAGGGDVQYFILRALEELGKD